MSGHSKWAQIHRQKGVADAKRGAIFTRLGNNITIAVKTGGGGNPDTNFKLQLAIDKAKGSNMPKDNIERAIKRGTGEAEGGIIEEITYEGFGPDGVAVIVECLTDNRNRTSSSIKHALAKNGGSLGGPNSVSWMFEQKGVIAIRNINENLELELIDAGVLDIEKEPEGVTIYTSFADLQKIKKLLEDKKIEIISAEIEQVPKEIKEVGPETVEKLEKMFQDLDDDGDVNNYFTNTNA
jgi:YebC/PmpR family DNA-binding regulatory protein